MGEISIVLMSAALSGLTLLVTWPLWERRPR